MSMSMKKVKGILIIPFGGSGAVHDIEINTENLDDYYICYVFLHC